MAQGPSYADMRQGKKIRNSQSGRDKPLMKGGSLVNNGGNANYQGEAKFQAPISLKAGSTPMMFKPATGLSSQGKSPSTPAVKAAQQSRFTTGQNPFKKASTAQGPTGMGGNAKMWGSGGDKSSAKGGNKMWANGRKSGGP